MTRLPKPSLVDDDLAGRRCVPCRGGVPPLGPEEVSRLQTAVPDWSVASDGKRLVRRFAFRDYARAFDLVARVSVLAEAEGHHPDVCFGWGYAEFSLTTHAIGGLHENDVVLAAKIDRLSASG